MTVALADRLVEVIAFTGSAYRYGSGCIVAGRTVLTAAHVVAGCVSIQVRTPKKELCTATLDGRFVSHGSDLALVEIDDGELDLPALPLARLDRDCASEAAVACHAYGYPWFAKRPSPATVRDVVDAVGTIPVLSKLATGLASVHVPDAPRALPPAEEKLADSTWQGMSGGPVISDGRLVGVVIEHAPREGQSTITLAPISLLEHDPDYPRWGPGVDDPGAWWRKLGIGGLADLVVLPAPSKSAGDGPELSPEAMERYQAAFRAAGVAPPARWTSSALSRIVVPDGASRLREVVSASRRAVQAKQVLLALEADRLGLAQLQVIYRREVGAWPDDDYVDGLLAQAAEVEESERRTRTAGDLGALARFVVGVAAARSVSPQANPELAAWIGSLGYQVADAEWRFQDQLGSRAWLLLDLGAEPRLAATGAGTPPWPNRITWTHVTRHCESTTKLAGEQRATPTPEGLSDALVAIFAALPPSHHLVVDLAIPAALLDAGIEHWPLFPDSLSDRHQARLRWSQRLHDLHLRSRCVERTARSSWTTIPRVLTEAVLADERRLQRWIRDDTVHAWLICRRSAAARTDPLRALLKAGYGFLVWFPETAGPRSPGRITRAVRQIPVAARRSVIPDEVPASPDGHLVIWDDPRGRGDDFTLPSPVAALPSGRPA